MQKSLIHLSPISILPSLANALEIVMRDLMVAYLTDIGALSPLQSGFRPGHSTVTALLNITDDIYGMLDEGYFVALVLLDFSKAFLTVLIIYCCVGSWRAVLFFRLSLCLS
jgi:hypothetical protein